MIPNSATFRTPTIYVDKIEKSFRIELQRQRALHAIQRRELDLSGHRRRQLVEKAQINWERRCEISALKDPSPAVLAEKAELEREAGANGWTHPNAEKEFLAAYPEHSIDPKSKITLLATPEAYDQREARPAQQHKARVSAMKTLTTLQSIQRSILIDEHEKDVRVPEAHAAVAISNMNKASNPSAIASSSSKGKNLNLKKNQASTTAIDSSSSSASSGAAVAGDIDGGGAVSMSTAASEVDLAAAGASESLASESHSQHASQGNKKKRPRESTGGDDGAYQDGADLDALENDDVDESELGDGTIGGAPKKSTRIVTEAERLYADMKKAKERALMFTGMRGCDRCGTIIAKADSVSCGSCKRDFCDRGGKHYEDPSIIPCVDLYRCLCGSKFCYDCVIGSESRVLGPLVRCAVCPKKSSNWMCRRELREASASRCPICNAHACRVCKGGAAEGARTAFEVHVDRCIKASNTSLAAEK